MKKLAKTKYLILLLLFLGFLLRLIKINQSLWLDEAIGAYAIKHFSYKDLFNHFFKADNHPPLYYLLLKFWTQIFGYSETSLRMPSAIFGGLTIFFTYKVAQKLTKNKFYPVLVCLFLATSAFHIYYSQEARMYSMACFFAVMSMNFFLSVLSSKNPKIFDLIIFSFSITSLVYTSYVTVFLLPVFLIAPLIERKNKLWFIKLFITFAPILILGLFWYPYFIIQSEKGGWLLRTLPAWKNLGGGANFKQVALVWMKFVLGRISFGDKVFYYSLVVISSLPFILSFWKAKNTLKKHYILWLWLFIPLVFAFVSSFTVPIFIYFRFLFVVPAFYLLLSLGIDNTKLQWLKKITIFAILGVNFVGWFIYISEPYQQREQWREATQFIDNKVTQEDVVIFEYPEPFAPYRWYTKGNIEAVGVTDSISANPDKTRQKTKRIIANKKKVYYFEYLRDLSDPGKVVEAVLKDEGFKIEEVYNFFPGVGQIFYWVK